MKISRSRSYVVVAFAALFAAVGFLTLITNLTLNGGFQLFNLQPFSARSVGNFSSGAPGTVIEIEQELDNRNFTSVSGDTGNLQFSLNDPSKTSLVSLAAELLYVTRGYRLINTLRIEEIKTEYDQSFAGGNLFSPEIKYDDPERVQQAMIRVWNANYPKISTFNQMVMPLGITNLQDASQFTVDLLTHPIQLDSFSPEIVQIFAPYELQGKNWLEIVFNTHGYDMPFGENAILGVEQPKWGDLHYTFLSFYAIPGSQDEQIAYIPISELYQGGGPLNLDNPTGSLRIRVKIGPGNGINIARISAFYLAP